MGPPSKVKSKQDPEARRLLARTSGRQPESVILSQVREYLRWRGWLVYRIQQGLGAHRGMADLIAVRNGAVWFIEIKTPRGRLSPHQERFRDDLRAHGGRYLVVRSLEDIETACEGDPALVGLED